MTTDQTVESLESFEDRIAREAREAALGITAHGADIIRRERYEDAKNLIDSKLRDICNQELISANEATDILLDTRRVVEDCRI